MYLIIRCEVRGVLFSNFIKLTHLPISFHFVKMNYTYTYTNHMGGGITFDGVRDEEFLRKNISS